MNNYQITQWCARFIREQVKPGDICIDATMGNGNDTLLPAAPEKSSPSIFRKARCAAQKKGCAKTAPRRTGHCSWNPMRICPATPNLAL